MEQGLRFIDCQVTTDHLLSLGAEEMSRKDFEMLQHELNYPTLRGAGSPLNGIFMAKQKAMFLLKLSYPVAMMILLISGFSLVISFYMGMITGQSMRSYRKQVLRLRKQIDQKHLISKRRSAFFGLSEPQKIK